MVKSRISDRQILHGFSFTFLFLLVAKSIGAVKEIALANAYGTGLSVDAYALSFAISNTPITLTAMAGNMILIPFFVARRRELDKVGAAAIIPWTMLLSIIASAATFIVLMNGELILRLSPDLAAAVAEQAPGFSLMVPTGIIATILSARLMAAKRQINSLFEAIPSLMLICGLLIFEKQIAANLLLGWFTCIGMFAYLSALILADSTAINDLKPGTFRLQMPSVIRMKEISLIIAAQTVFVFSSVLLDQLAAASLPNEQNSILAYANRLIMLITSLGATAVGRAVLPVLTELRLDGGGEEFSITRRWAAYLFGAGMVAWGIGYISAPYGIKLLFEHGQFTARDTYLVTEVFRAGLMVLPFYFPSLILSQSVVVQRRFGLLLISNVISMLFKVLLIFLFLENWGLSLIMYSSVAKQAVAILIMVPALRPSKQEQARNGRADN